MYFILRRLDVRMSSASWVWIPSHLIIMRHADKK